MVLYHEISQNLLPDALKNGLRCTSRGEKGQAAAIIRTDEFLDSICPPELKQRGVSRDNNLYTFLGNETAVKDIKTGGYVPLSNYRKQGRQLLRLQVPFGNCFLSNLDLYDAVKQNIQQLSEAELRQLGVRYWAAVVPLEQADLAMVPRPEVMITTDVSPRQIEVL